MKKIYLLTICGLLLSTGMLLAQPAIYSSSAIFQTSPGNYDTYKCAQGATTLWTDSIYTSYLWSTGDTTPMITLAAAGNITLTAGGGTSTANVIQDQIANQNTITPGFYQDACQGDSIELQTFIDSSTGWLLWSWGDTVFSINDCDESYLGQGCGMYRYTSGIYGYIRYNSNNGCFYSSFNPQLDFLASPSATITQSNDTLFALSAPFVSFQWYDGNQVAIPNATNDWYYPTAVDSYYVEAFNTTSAGNCTGPLSPGYYWTSNCIASYYHFPDTSNQYSIIIVNTSVPAPGPNVSYAWDFGDGNSSTQAYPIHQYAGPGTYNVCVTVSDGTCSHTFCDNITVTSKVNTPFTINVVDPGTLNTPVPGTSALNLVVWPQPAESELALRFDLQAATTVQLDLFDMHGRRTRGIAPLETSAGEQQIRLDCGGLAAGIYLMRLQTGDEFHLRKVAVGH